MCKLPGQGLPADRSQPEVGCSPPLTVLPLGTQVCPLPAPSPDVPWVALPSPPEASPVPPSWTRSPLAPGPRPQAPRPLVLSRGLLEALPPQASRGRPRHVTQSWGGGREQPRLVSSGLFWF